MTTIHIAIIGTGLIGSLYACSCHQMPGVQVVAVHDSHADRANKMASLVGGRAYSEADYIEMLAAHPEIDGVLVCTPVTHHLAPAMAVVEAGKHLLLEKPAATNLSDSIRIEQAATRAGVIAMISYSLRFDPRYAATKQAVEDRQIGEVIHLYGQRNPSLDAYKRIGGRVSLLFWVTVHDVDMARWITNSEITQVYALASQIGFEDERHERAILSNLIFASGAIAVLENAWRATSASHPQLSVSSFQANGTRWSIEIRDAHSIVNVISDGITMTPDAISMPEVAGEIVGTYRNELAAFVRSICERTPSLIPLSEDVKEIAVVEAI